MGERLAKWRVCVAILLVCCAAAACSPSVARAPRPLPPAGDTLLADAPDSVAAPLPTISTFSYSPGTYRYELISESEIRQTNDTLPREAHVRTQALVTLHLDSLAEDSLAARLTLDSIRVDRDSLVPAPDSLETTPASSFLATINVRGLSLDSVAVPGQTCADDGSGELLAIARDLLVQVPPELRVGDSWSDTSTVAICRGGVPVSTGVVRHYEVLEPRRDADGRALARVARTTAFSLAGTQTTTYGQVIALSGAGESRAVLELDASNGVVRSATRDGTSDVTVTYGRGSTLFAQRVRQLLRLVDN